MTDLGRMALIAFAICIPWWLYENYKQRPLSDFPKLDDTFKLFPENLKRIHKKGTISRQEYLRYLKSYRDQVSAEIKRRELKSLTKNRS